MVRHETDPISVHFWTRRPEALTTWDPDEAPQQHQNAFGHAFLEMYWRLRAKALPVTLGPKPPHGCTVVVVSFEELANYQPQVPSTLMARLALSLLPLRRMPAVVVFRVDAALSVRPPSFTTLEVMATKGAVETPRQTWLPLLPQRGLQVRDPARGDRIETVALKAYSYNVPVWVDDRFISRLSELGMNLRIDTELNGMWHDFREVDVVLCTQRLQPGTDRPAIDDRRKPPTKLINAWAAGAIPVCGDHRGYREIAETGTDALFARDEPDAFLAALSALRSKPQLVSSMMAAIAKRSEQFSIEQVSTDTWNALTEAPPAKRRDVTIEAARALFAEAVHRVKSAARRRRHVV
ncbi:hypothetical protein [Microbacterium sp. H1-D42]|uniref:glycosyltransferase n=1 Tax=Microbacterium sp. H1-D42 TaxID=2925844 RepID=UPI001F53B49C|nr:hypothetical protein [Microbacterium sp. H1-D42]UNK70134.1 hypothetical protein MNR00_13315 [Microbacterium sp. H1-D42]